MIVELIGIVCICRIVCYFCKFIFITLGIDAGHSLYSEQGSKAQHSNLNTEFRFGSCNIGPIRIPGHFILSASFCYIYIVPFFSQPLLQRRGERLSRVFRQSLSCIHLTVRRCLEHSKPETTRVPGKEFSKFTTTCHYMSLLCHP